MNANQINDMLWLILEAKLFHNQYIFGARGLPRCAREIKKPGWFARLFLALMMRLHH